MELHFPERAGSATLLEFSPPDAADELWESYFRLTEELFAEFNPDDRLPERSVVRRNLLTANPLYQVSRWLLFDRSGSAIAQASIAFDTPLSPDFESSRHIGKIQLAVLHAERRKKFASFLIKLMAEHVVQLGKELVITEVDNPQGIRFCKTLQGELVHEEVQHRLRLDVIDDELIERWLKKGRTKTADIGIEIFQECPPADLEEFCCAFTESINQRPTGEMQGELITTPESRRIEERNLRRRGIEWYTMISREPDGRVSGLTDILYNPLEPHKVNQYFTGVLRAYRRRGLAKRLKAEMLRAIQRMFPDAEYVTTSTAETNLPMRAINKSLGFQPHKHYRMYQWAAPDLVRQAEAILARGYQIHGR